MLKLDGDVFACGRSTYLDLAEQEGTSKVSVRVRIDDIVTTAQLDTGSPWCLLDAQLALVAGLLEEDDFQGGSQLPQLLSTRLGRIRGRLVRKELVLLADEGDSLAVQATLFVSPEWTGPSFVGYSGCIERVRMALDPLHNHFYFGPA